MRAFGWNGTFFNESEMALFSECMLQCARNVLTPPTLSETPDYANHLDMKPSSNQNSRCETCQFPSSSCRAGTSPWGDQGFLGVSRAGHARFRSEMRFQLYRP